jgi:cytochrome b6-f complex iron-sulfur subunit
MERREFMHRLILGSGLALTVPVLFTACKDDDNEELPEGLQIDLSNEKYSKLNTEGESINEGDIIIANIGGGSYVALSRTCTHQGCYIKYIKDNGNFQCPCHGSTYSNDGSVVTGPATIAVQSYEIEKHGNILVIKNV